MVALRSPVFAHQVGQAGWGERLRTGRWGGWNRRRGPLAGQTRQGLVFTSVEGIGSWVASRHACPVRPTDRPVRASRGQVGQGRRQRQARGSRRVGGGA
eukprot:2722296-Alexandrium_andersonii.AAC.1